MKKYLIAIATILASALHAPSALAGGYGGLAFGQFSSEDIDTYNLGIALGSINESGLGYELFYAFSVIDDEDSSNGVDIEADSDVVALYVVYQTPGDVYFKAKGGYGYANITFDIEDQGSSSDSTAGFSYGLSGGISVGDGSLELTYYVFPDFDEFNGVDVDAEVELINLTYLWSF
jgi:hypothetical protein